MKKKKELDVDFIGVQNPLTKEQENMISAYLTRRSKQKSDTQSKKTSKKKIAV